MCTKSVQIAKIMILNLEGIIKKISYERLESRLRVSRRKEKSILNYVPETESDEKKKWCCFR